MIVDIIKEIIIIDIHVHTKNGCLQNSLKQQQQYARFYSSGYKLFISSLLSYFILTLTHF
jgi:hypothetical protein